MSGAVVEVSAINSLHREMIELWHREEVSNPYTGFLRVVCQQLSFNFLLWHEEDKVRAANATLEEVAFAKRKIDQLNQSRNDWMERIDDSITQTLEGLGVVAGPTKPQNSESVGSVIDRLSIMALRIFHLSELVNAESATADQRSKASARLAVALEQHSDLTLALVQLAADIASGQKRHKTYHQLKLYNDPTFNPLLGKTSQLLESGSKQL